MVPPASHLATLIHKAWVYNLWLPPRRGGGNMSTLKSIIHDTRQLTRRTRWWYRKYMLEEVGGEDPPGSQSQDQGSSLCGSHWRTSTCFVPKLDSITDISVSKRCCNRVASTGWLRTTKCILSQFWRLEVWNRCRCGSLWQLWGRIWVTTSS